MSLRSAMVLVGLLITSSFVFSCGDYSQELAEEACDREVKCGELDDQEYDDCVDEVDLELSRTENSGFACRDAAREFVECGIELDCGVDPEEACSEEFDTADEYCEVEVNIPW